MDIHKSNSTAGFSLIEILIVISVISVLTGISMIYLNASQRLYKPDTQSLQIVDILQEARQRSLTQRRTMRVEIDLDDNLVRLIDEDKSNTADDDKLIRSLSLLPSAEIKVNQRPSNITDDPPELLPTPHALFTLSNYPKSTAHWVCTMRFQSNGSVVSAGSTPTGTGAIPTGVTLFVWAPKDGSTTEANISRAITVIGTSGSVRLWEYDKNATTPNRWKNSRRTAGFGG